MYERVVPVVLQVLTQAQGLLAKADPELLEARLSPEMFSCRDQFRTLASMALRAVFPLIGREAPNLPDGDVSDILKFAAKTVAGVPLSDFAGADSRRIIHRAGFADLDQTADDYVKHFILPNMWFHLSMAYAILRQNGAPVGKADFDGLHVYPADFSWNR